MPSPSPTRIQPQARSPRLTPPQPHGPAATISRRAADRLRSGHLWVYRSDIETLTPAPTATDLAPGTLLTVTDSRGLPLGSALYSDTSEIALRLVSPTPGLTREAYLADTRQRIASALALRAQLSPISPTDNAHRLLFSEADNLPGIIADRYNDLIILQLLTQGTAQDDLRALLTQSLTEADPALTLWERPDPRIRELEHLAAPSPGPLHTSTPDTPRTSTLFTINGLRFHFEATSGQKTGAFLDQRLNYAAAASHAHGTALDICTYQGGFALHLAQRCTEVTGVDASRAALEVADRNLALNPHLPARTSWIEADAFDLLREYDATHQQYDTIVLDPPAFAKSRRATEGALRGYKELNLRALRMLRPGGTLVTCSCSHHIPIEAFLQVVTAAATDAGRRVQLLETRGASPDHPAILTLPETTYLKCLILRVD